MKSWSVMPSAHKSLQSRLPSIDRLLRLPEIEALSEAQGRPIVTETARECLTALREAISTSPPDTAIDIEDATIAARIAVGVAEKLSPSLRRVHNLTGTVLHTNLGRAALPDEAMEAIRDVATGASNLEFDIATGKRGDRDTHLEERLCRLTGAEAATVVNNNAAAVMLVLNSLALRKEVPVSRGELIEIGGSFRMPDIMSRAGCKLVEVGTTNRTHLKDFEQAIGPKTAMIMKVHTSNYVVQGFTATVPENELAALCHDRGIPFANDLGSGTLVDLTRFGLPHEPTPQEAIADGADVVTFSGDKLLGGPQAGLIVGTADCIAKIKRNPMKRALRVDKMTIAALSAILALYENPDSLAEKVPTLRMLARAPGDIDAAARRLVPHLKNLFGDTASVEIIDCFSQIGSGALPVESLHSKAVAITPNVAKKGGALKRMAAQFAHLPTPVIGRVQDDRLIFDFRCLDDEDGFIAQLTGFGDPR
jgi:L-seryl-tRNA(Ser) seleniumtransferase